MPSYKAVVEGQNFVFEVDNEPQNINFYKTMYINALNESEAEDVAINQVTQHVLDDSGIVFDPASGFESILIDEIEQIEVIDENIHVDSDLVWFFSEEDYV